MKTKRWMMVTPAVLGAAVLMGCEERHERTVYVERPAPPPQEVVVAPSPQPVVVAPPQERVVYVEQQPAPAPIIEVVPGRPHPQAVWIEGRWEHRGRYWEWHRGSWR